MVVQNIELRIPGLDATRVGAGPYECCRVDYEI